MLLEEQRKSTWAMLRKNLPALANGKCHSRDCTHTGTDPAFPYTMASKVYNRAINHMPWPLTDDSLKLRTVLRMTRNCGPVPVSLATGCVHERELVLMATEQSLREVCKDASDIASGLCATCIRREQFDEQHCAHSARFRLWTESDPFT